MMIPFKINKQYTKIEKKKSISNDFFICSMQGQNYWDYNWEKVHCHF